MSYTDYMAPNSMRAAVFHGNHDIRIEDVPEAVTGSGEVKVAVAHNGLCGSDLHEYLMGPIAIPAAPHPLTGAMLPVIMGHEFAGTVVDIGAGVTTVAMGDRVAVEPIYHCGRCRQCVAGAYNVCSSVAFHGLMANGGGLSERTVVAESMVHRLPDEVTLAQGALVEPMAVALHAVRRSGITAGEPAVVFGAGPIGIGAWYALRALGAGPIVVAETSPHRRAVLERLGAPHVLDPSTVDVVAATLELTGGEGAAAAIDAAGVPATALGSLRVLRPRGCAVSVGVSAAPVEVDVLMLMSEISWTGSLAYTGEDFATVIEHMATGRYPAEGWVQHIALDDLTSGLDAMAEGRAVKLLVDINGTSS
jgi:(R,R)-butanediol dehydrogenase/meso-butanediol dehydrogenase/diacetyl reductase